jgi:hypothetical protein
MFSFFVLFLLTMTVFLLIYTVLKSKSTIITKTTISHRTLFTGKNLWEINLTDVHKIEISYYSTGYLKLQTFVVIDKKGDKFKFELIHIYLEDVTKIFSRLEIPFLIKQNKLRYRPTKNLWS